MRALASLALLSTTILLSPHVASADSAGKKGRVIEISVNEPSSDDYAKFHGSVEIYSKKTKATYHWGGSYCPGKDLSAESVERLTQAFMTRRWTKVKPRYKNGQGGKKCLVGFAIEGSAKDKLN
jgi:hypothetical protein